MLFIYELGIWLLTGAIRLAALFHPKAKKWVTGRRQWRSRYRSAFQKNKRLLWIHAASLGEFEQGRPVLEAFREQFPDWQIVLTFFSPSGYEIRKIYSGADFVAYLPADTHRNARDFLDWLQPDAAIFIKYEFWANYLFELKKRGTPTLLVSALFRQKQVFFRPYGHFWRRVLGCFSHIFVQNEASAALLRQIGIRNMSRAGDTRVDRVLKLSASVPENATLQAFVPAGEKAALIVGSSWPADEALLLPLLDAPGFAQQKWVIAPHEPAARHLAQLLPRLPQPFARYSDGAASHAIHAARVLVIDNIGLLNTLYRYGRVAYIGGGFGKGIHNTLEPAAYGLPVLFGPRFEKFEEARQLVARGGAFVVRHTEECKAILARLQDETEYQRASQAARQYLEDNRGATDKIMTHLSRLCPDL
ncbi:MAG: 3-deoxy-D-manno-octulosonic acid transferase [Saprospirales bacterium]|nr:3-deoxy-D-manno-octulosonic acid transferase [Saprospirales bacterium]